MLIDKGDGEEIYQEEVEKERKAFEVLNELECSNVVQGRALEEIFLMQLMDGDVSSLAGKLPNNVVAGVCRSLQRYSTACGKIRSSTPTSNL